MNIKEIGNNIKEFFSKKVSDFKSLSTVKKLVLIIAVITLVLSLIFGIKYIINRLRHLFYVYKESKEPSKRKKRDTNIIPCPCRYKDQEKVKGPR